MVATLRADFQPQVIAHPGLRAVLNGGGTYYVGAPGPLALARMIEGPAQAVGLTVEPALTARLVAEADREPGGLALLAAALQDTWLAAADAGTLTLRHYSKAVGGIKGVLSRRGRRGLALLWPQGRAALPRVFGHLIHLDPDTGAATRRRVPLDQWPPDGPERRLIEVFSRDADRPRDAVRLLVCGEHQGQATVEVAHEALLREWPRLAVWIRTRREALIRRDEVRRDAARWDERGRPDHLLPHPELLAEVRARLAAAGLWEDLRREERIAWFLAQDDLADLCDLTLDAFHRHGGDGAAAALPLLACLTAPGRTWETSVALGRWALEQESGIADWLRAGLAEVLALLGTEDALSWHRRRLGIGDLLAALGDRRPGVGLRPDGLPAIDWVAVAPGVPTRGGWGPGHRQGRANRPLPGHQRPLPGLYPGVRLPECALVARGLWGTRARAVPLDPAQPAAGLGRLGRGHGLLPLAQRPLPGGGPDRTRGADSPADRARMGRGGPRRDRVGLPLGGRLSGRPCQR